LLPPASFPAGYDSTDNVAVELPRTLISLLAQGISQWEHRRYWDSDSDYESGYQAALLLQERLLKPQADFTPGNMYLAMGDSWSVGKESTANEDELPGYPMQFWLQLYYWFWPGLAYANVGISGETTSSMLAPGGQYDTALTYINFERSQGRRVGLITISIGGNDMIQVFPFPIGSSADGNTVLATIETNLHTIYSGLRQAEPEAIILTMTYANLYPVFNFPGYGTLSDTWLPQLHALIRRVAALYDIYVAAVDDLDTSDEALMNRLFYVTRPYALWPPSNPVKHFDFHPRPEGHQYIAWKLWEALKQRTCGFLPDKEAYKFDGGSLTPQLVRFVLDGGDLTDRPVDRYVNGGVYGSH
jgi:lysophospholipase L1-like esterase